MKILPDGDGKPPGGGDDSKPKPPASPAPAGPATPDVVKRTPIRHPQIIALEKKVSELEDATGALEEALAGVNSLLESAQIGAPSGQKKKIPVADLNKPAATPPEVSDVDKFLWG